MTLKEKFLTYCELQRNARNYKERLGEVHQSTYEAYDRANKAKREVLEMIEELEQFKWMYESLNK
jgi:hypothetical protein